MKKLVLLIAGFTAAGWLCAQPADSLRVSLQQAEQIFLNKNLLLLAQKYNIEASRALIIQARLWPNPNFDIAQGAYNTQTHKWFETGTTTGETSIQLQQLILLAGKINKQVKIAEANTRLAEYGFYDLLRTLKYTLRNDFFNIYYLQQTATVYDEEINSLKKIVTAFEQQRDKGYIARTEVVRIKEQLYSLQSELNDLINQINDKQSELRLVLQSSRTYILPIVDTIALLRASPGSYSLEALLDSAYHNRTDLMIARGNLTLSQRNYAYQKALAVPDLTLGAAYDKNGSYIHNFNSLGVGFNIPLFNRNQGNIKSAKNQIAMFDTQLQSTEKTIEEQVYRGLEKAIASEKIFSNIDKTFTAEFAQLAKAMFDNYSRRNIGLLEFLNFYDSYKQYIVQLNYILFNKVSALENLNFLTGTNFFN
jgi:outer membrane protein, heavy metal efflux system